MSDSDFVDVGDELVVRIGGYPVAKAKVLGYINNFDEKKKIHVGLMRDNGDVIYYFYLPLDFKNYDKVDGYGHGTQPLTGVEPLPHFEEGELTNG